MRYADDTFALYNDLFKEAHSVLQKEAGVREWLARRIDPRSFQRMADTAEQATRAEEALGAAAHAQEGLKYDQLLAQRQAENLAKEVQAYGQTPGALTEAQQAAQRARTGRNVALGVGGLGLGVGLPAAYMAGQGQGAADKTRTRNIAFGAGAAAGIAAPTLIRGLGSIARGAGQSGAFPELEGYY